MTPTSVSGMPGKGTKRRSVRIDDETWAAAMAAAERKEENLSEVVRRALLEYIES